MSDVGTIKNPDVFSGERVVIGRDEEGFACLAHDCPDCGATALIVNEWDAAECLSCSWREFEPPAA